MRRLKPLLKFWLFKNHGPFGDSFAIKSKMPSFLMRASFLRHNAMAEKHLKYWAMIY